MRGFLKISNDHKMSAATAIEVLQPLPRRGIGSFRHCEEMFLCAAIGTEEFNRCHISSAVRLLDGGHTVISRSRIRTNLSARPVGSCRLSESDVISKTRVAIVWVRLRREFKVKSELVRDTLEKRTGVKQVIQILIFLPILGFSETFLHEVLNSFFVVLSLHFFITHVKKKSRFSI